MARNDTPPDEPEAPAPGPAPEVEPVEPDTSEQDPDAPKSGDFIAFGANAHSVNGVEFEVDPETGCIK